MKKTHWFRNTLITLVACGLVGLVVALILFNANPGRTGATSTIEFSFEGAAEGLAPNGIRYDLNGFTSDTVLNAALASAGMADRYTPAQLKDNILVTGVYPEDIVQQMTGYESVLTGDAGKVATADYHATLYNVTLYNDFDKKISKDDLEKLLTAIMTEFRTYFEKTYALFLTKDTLLEGMADYDYSLQVELMKNSVSRYESYANQMAAEHSEFMINGEGFADIAVRYQNLRTLDIKRLTGLMTMNAVSRDTERLMSQYDNQIKILDIDIKELQKEAENIQKLIQTYEKQKDDLIFVSTAEKLQQVGTRSTSTYDTLVNARHAIQLNITELEKEKSDLEERLTDLKTGENAATTTATPTVSETADAEGEAEAEANQTTAEPAEELNTEAQKAVVEKRIESASKKLDAIMDDFSSFLAAYSAREMNDATIALTEVEYDTPKILSGTFIKLVIKTAGPFCALGFMACMVLLIRARRREEKMA